MLIGANGSGKFGIENYFSKIYIDELIDNKRDNPQYVSFASMPALKNDLGKEETVFHSKELERFKPSIDLLLEIIAILRHRI